LTPPPALKSWQRSFKVLSKGPSFSISLLSRLVLPPQTLLPSPRPRGLPLLSCATYRTRERGPPFPHPLALLCLKLLAYSQCFHCCLLAIISLAPAAPFPSCPRLLGIRCSSLVLRAGVFPLYAEEIQVRRLASVLPTQLVARFRPLLLPPARCAAFFQPSTHLLDDQNLLRPSRSSC